MLQLVGWLMLGVANFNVIRWLFYVVDCGRNYGCYHGGIRSGYDPDINKINVPTGL